MARDAVQMAAGLPGRRKVVDGIRAPEQRILDAADALDRDQQIMGTALLIGEHGVTPRRRGGTRYDELLAGRRLMLLAPAGKTLLLDDPTQRIAM